jgi:hypothetical protein
MVVTHRHTRELGYCNRGLRQWFAREGLDWADFLKNGIDAEVLRGRDNAMAERAIKHAQGVSDGR